MAVTQTSNHRRRAFAPRAVFAAFEREGKKQRRAAWEGLPFRSIAANSWPLGKTHAGCRRGRSLTGTFFVFLS